MSRASNWPILLTANWAVVASMRRLLFGRHRAWRPVIVLENDFGVVEKVIPGGRVAVVRHVGSYDTIGATVREMYSNRLPRSGEELRDFPRFFEYVSRMPQVKEHEQVTDIYLLLR